VRGFVLLALGVALAFPASGAGAGGDDISTAPEMPTSIRQYSAKFGPDFWKIFLNVGDLMTLDYSSTDGDRVSVCLLPPTVGGASTDSTDTTPTTTDLFPTTTTDTTPATSSTPLTDDQCAARDSTFTKARLSLSVVNPPGYWTLVFADGLCAPHNYTTTCPTYDVAYSSVLTVRRFTQTLVSAPAAAPRNATIELSGRVVGMSGGYVEAQTQRDGKWVSLGLVPLNATGQFNRRTRLPGKRGLYPFKVTFYGDDEHRPSGRTVAIRVA
jgi:hypothetical protein